MFQHCNVRTCTCQLLVVCVYMYVLVVKHDGCVHACCMLTPVNSYGTCVHVCMHVYRARESRYCCLVSMCARFEKEFAYIKATV